MASLLSSLSLSPTPQTDLSRMVHAAAYARQPNIPLNHEIADYININKKNCAREAVMQCCEILNSSQGGGVIVLELLDTLVKNCGYPVHLQIGSKEVLNALVRRFPERPPHVSDRIIEKVLELIQQWTLTICETSKYKHDLRHILDMKKLLQYKGYMFPLIRQETTAVLNARNEFKTVTELEREDEEAQAAKLQELLRRSTPAALAEANALMKVMTGYNREERPDYEAIFEKECSAASHKAEMLVEAITSGDIRKKIEDYHRDLLNTQLKVKKMIETDGQEDDEALLKLLRLNDLMNEALQVHADWLGGSVSTIRKPQPQPIPQEAPQSANLIDLGESSPERTNVKPNTNPLAEFDLLM